MFGLKEALSQEARSLLTQPASDGIGNQDQTETSGDGAWGQKGFHTMPGPPARCSQPFFQPMSFQHPGGSSKGGCSSVGCAGMWGSCSLLLNAN